MSASDLKPGAHESRFLPASEEALSAGLSPTLNHKNELGSEELELLREFFLLLDQWDQAEH